MNYGHGEGCGKSTGFEDRMGIIYFTVSLSIKKSKCIQRIDTMYKCHNLAMHNGRCRMITRYLLHVDIVTYILYTTTH